MNTHTMHVIRDTVPFDAEEDVAKAERLYRQGLRVSVIAAEMGIGVQGLRGLMKRNAHRFASRSERSQARRQQSVLKLAELRRRGGASDEALTALFGTFAAGREIPRLQDEAVTMMELKSSHCRWPVGEVRGAETLFCGRQRAVRSYCPEHAARAAMKAERCP